MSFRLSRMCQGLLLFFVPFPNARAEGSCRSWITPGEVQSRLSWMPGALNGSGFFTHAARRSFAKKLVLLAPGFVPFCPGTRTATPTSVQTPRQNRGIPKTEKENAEVGFEPTAFGL